MQSRRSVAGRPSGTDGSDFSYRMVVDSRYTRVASGKSCLSRLLIVQVLLEGPSIHVHRFFNHVLYLLAIIFVASALSILFPVVSGDEPELVSSSAAGISLMALLMGQLGQRRSRSSLLKIYMVLSSVSLVLFLVCTVDRKLMTELADGQISSIWGNQKLQLIKAILVLTGSLVQVVAVSTTITLISNMSPPKRSS